MPCNDNDVEKMIKRRSKGRSEFTLNTDEEVPATRIPRKMVNGMNKQVSLTTSTGPLPRN
jgi:hypothetical protein